MSNPELRSRYDSARTHAGDRAARQAAEADAQAARQRAEQYPRRWADMEAWLNGVAQDFAGAQYGSVPLYQDVSFPTAGGSVSGWAFILIGAVLGGVFLSPVIDGILDSNKATIEKNRILGLIGLALVAAPVVGGAWAGAGIHKWIGDEVKKAKEQAARQAQRHQEREAKRAQPAPPPAAALEPRVLACERCGQKLRVPVMQSELLVTCKSCGHKFGCPPA
jgi:hypothetical protein